jgi:hypothetical protein
MGLKDTILGWMRQGGSDDLEKAEVDAEDPIYEGAKADEFTSQRLGSGHDAFDADQSAPR